MSVVAPEITQSGTTAPEIVQSDDFVSLVFSDSSKGGEYEVSASTTVNTDTNVKGAEFKAAEGTTLDLSFGEGTFKKCDISGSDQSDTVVFKKGTVLKGKTKLDLGDGANITKIKGEIDGKVVIKNFNEGSSVKYEGEKYGVDDVEAAKEVNIIIKLED